MQFYLVILSEVGKISIYPGWGLNYIKVVYSEFQSLLKKTAKVTRKGLIENVHFSGIPWRSSG